MQLPIIGNPEFVGKSTQRGGCSPTSSQSGVRFASANSGTAIGQAGVAASKNNGVDVYIIRWTTDEEVQDFAATLAESGRTDW